MARFGWTLALLTVAAWSLGCTSSGSKGGVRTRGSAASGGSAGSAGTGGRDVSAAIAAMVESVDPARYEANLRTVARVRNHGSVAWQETQDFCATRLEELGFEVERHDFGTGVNVIGTMAGNADRQIIVSAHYDAVPNCIGADDNASGVAGALETARVLSMGTFDDTLVVACWDQEEVGLLGARAYANRARERGVDVEAMYSLEMIGFKSDLPSSQTLPPGLDLLFPEQVAMLEANEFRGDFIAIVTDERSRALNDAFERYADDVGLSWMELKLPAALLTNPVTADLRRSDHAAFWAAGYPGVMLTDTANFRNSHYHCSGGSDTVDRLDTEFSVQIIKSVVGAMATELGLRL